MRSGIVGLLGRLGRSVMRRDAVRVFEENFKYVTELDNSTLAAVVRRVTDNDNKWCLFFSSLSVTGVLSGRVAVRDVAIFGSISEVVTRSEFHFCVGHTGERVGSRMHVFAYAFVCFTRNKQRRLRRPGDPSVRGEPHQRLLYVISDWIRARRFDLPDERSESVYRVSAARQVVN